MCGLVKGLVKGSSKRLVEMQIDCFAKHYTRKRIGLVEQVGLCSGRSNTCGDCCVLMSSEMKAILFRKGNRLKGGGNALTLTPSPAYGSTWGRKQFH